MGKLIWQSALYDLRLLSKPEHHYIKILAMVCAALNDVFDIANKKKTLVASSTNVRCAERYIYMNIRAVLDRTV